MSIISDIFEYFVENEGRTVTLKELAEHTGKEEKQIQHGVTNLRHGHPEYRDHIVPILRGRSWRYSVKEPTPTPTPSKKGKRVFEEVGESKNGDIVLECENGKLYRASEL